MKLPEVIKMIVESLSFNWPLDLSTRKFMPYGMDRSANNSLRWSPDEGKDDHLVNTGFGQLLLNDWIGGAAVDGLACLHAGWLFFWIVAGVQDRGRKLVEADGL